MMGQSHPIASKLGRGRYRTWSLGIVWTVTTSSIALALLPAFISRNTPGTVTTYDPMVALTCLTVIGLAWYTHFTAGQLAHLRQVAEQEAASLRAERERTALSVDNALQLALTLARDEQPSGKELARLERSLDLLLAQPYLLDHATMIALASVRQGTMIARYALRRRARATLKVRNLPEGTHRNLAIEMSRQRDADVATAHSELRELCESVTAPSSDAEREKTPGINDH